jgi:hypothetical protein
MKWIGQHIWGFISRFRNDVYLEDVSSGTITSGGNLGLDSNNKIVKATISSGSGDITGVTLAGDSGSASDTSANVDLTIAGGNAITTSGSSTTITINHDDTSSQASVDNSGRTFIQDITLDTYGHVTGITSATDSDTHSGDITAVTITTDSGSGSKASDTEGSADFSILGTSGVGVTNSSNEITVTSVPGEIDHDSLQNFVAAEHYDWSGDISSTATIHANNITDLHGAGVDGSANQLLTDDGDGSITSESNLTYNGTDLTAVSSSEGKPVLTLKTTHTTKTKSAELQFLKDAADTEDGENLGIITFYGENESNSNTKFGHIKGSIQESDAGVEGGNIKLAVATHDGEMVNGLVINDGNSEDEIDVTIGSTATSITTVAGTLTMGSTATLNNSGLLQVANQSNITGVGTITSGVWNGTAIAHAYIGADAIENDNIADEAVKFENTQGITPKVHGSTIKLIPSDFMANDDGGNTKFGVGYVESAGTLYGMRPGNNAVELFAFVSIPEGMKATHVDIFDKNDVGVIVYEAQINATTMTSKGTGNCNTTIDITDVNSTDTNFLAIQVTTTSVNDKVFGGKVTIAAQ